MAKHRSLTYSSTCPVHGKRTYTCRLAAKRRIRLLHDAGMREYKCDDGRGWHIGHLAPIVRDGRKTAAELYGGSHA